MFIEAVEKWVNCNYGAAFKLRSNVGPKFYEDGLHQSYVCTNLLVKQPGRIITVLENGQLKRGLVLHMLGRLTDNSVEQALKKSCLNCPYFTLKQI